MKLTKVTIEIPEIWKKLIEDSVKDLPQLLREDCIHKKPYLKLITGCLERTFGLPSQSMLKKWKISTDKWYKVTEILDTPELKRVLSRHYQYRDIKYYINFEFVLNPDKQEFIKFFKRKIGYFEQPEHIKIVTEAVIDCMTILFDDGCRGLFVDEESNTPRAIPKIVFKDTDEISLKKYIETGEWFAAKDIDTSLKNHAVSRRLGTYVKKQPFEQDGIVVERKIGSPYKYRLVKKTEKKAEQLPLGLDT